ncbi:MAG: DUF3179 domain-containing protein [Minwuia sp.]|nr:DUF3179 domain-containing protein [Minwuia sp.]
MRRTLSAFIAFSGLVGAVMAVVTLATVTTSSQTLAQTEEQYVRYWEREWPNTDFTKTSVDFGEILHGGPPRDGIPPIDEPAFVGVAEANAILADREPVIGLIVNGEAKAYPLQVLMFHEIANDTIGGVPVSVTFCPLCNAAIVFDRRVGDQVLDFGTTGKLRRSDLVMWDRQTESWWQQFLGEAIVGEMTGTRLKMLPSRLESWARFRARAPEAQVLVPNGKHYRSYGGNPYQAYDSSSRPFLYRGDLPSGIPPLMRVVTLGERGAWSLDFMKRNRVVHLDDGTTIRWEPGQASALDTPEIAEGRDVGNFIVTRMEDGREVDVLHGVDFVFAYSAFYPDAPIHHTTTQ